MLKSYLAKVLEVTRLGDAREESYYSALESLLIEFAKSTNRKDIHVTILPKKTDAGNPDFRIWDSKRRIIGYIEAKSPEKNLNIVDKTEQVERYKNTFPNFILTNFVEFRLYKNALCVAKVIIADSDAVYSLKGTPLIGSDEEVNSFLEKFFSFSMPSITSADVLAVELAKRTRFLRDEVIAEEIDEEEKTGLKRILGFYEAFQRYLIRGLTKEQFADLYSQTITYGLFASRMRDGREFNRKVAVYDIPHTIGILRDMFHFISLGDLPPQLEWIVDEISDVLASVDVKGIFSEYFKSKKGEDPVFPFYERFLAEYDPKEREKRGVYYTPEPVVSFIVRSLHRILKKKLGLNDGLASEEVTILDPAAGTLTFLSETVKQAFKEFVSKYGEGGKKDFIREHILKDFYAFELMIAPYTIGHLKLSFLIEELGYRLKEDERVKFYLTNTLEFEDIEQTSLPGMASLAEESRKAGEVKKKVPILVILGNPPYSGISTNKGEWISELIEEYKYVDGVHFGERKHWLHDDYVKFIRFAEWKISQAEVGIVGYITNHSYIDNPTFRGMRQHLMETFDEIYVLDLHGNSLKKERCPDGSKDENVFEIQQGVAISFFVKINSKSKSPCKVFHSELWGLAESKYEWLLNNDYKTTLWTEIKPHSPSYLYIPQEEKYRKAYDKFWKITDIFPVNSVGIVTARDKFVMDLDREELEARIKSFRDLNISDEAIRKRYALKDTSTFELTRSREILSQDRNWKEHFTRILCRPFDERYIYYDSTVVERPLHKVMHHMMRNNLGLITSRQVLREFRHAFVSNKINNFNLLDTAGRFGSGYLFPLYLYYSSETKASNTKREANIGKSFYKSLKTYLRRPTPTQILSYVYASLYSSVYRKKYAEQLQKDFPRIPITSDYRLFSKIAVLGKKLVDLHLLKSQELLVPSVRFQGDGDNTVKHPIYDKAELRVYINDSQYFSGVPVNVWEYRIGGYQVLYDWLNHRKRTKLSLEDIKQFSRIVPVIKSTIEVQKKIDKLYPRIEENCIEYKENKHADLKGYA